MDILSIRFLKLFSRFGFGRRVDTEEVYVRPDESLQIEFNNPSRKRDDWFFLSAVDNDEGRNLILLSVIAELEAKDRIEPLEPGEKVVHIRGKKLRLKGKINLEWRMARQDRNNLPRCDQGMSTLNEKKNNEPNRPSDGETLSGEEGQRADTFYTTLFYVADVANLPYDATISSGALQDCKLTRADNGAQERGLPRLDCTTVET